jgi:Zn-dependent protease with chaperone function
MTKHYYIAGAAVLCIVSIAIAIVHSEASETRDAIQRATRPDPQEAIDSAGHAVDRVMQQAPKAEKLLDSATKAAESILGGRSASPQDDRLGTNDPTSKEPQNRNDRADGGSAEKPPARGASHSAGATHADPLSGLADRAFDIAGKLTESADNEGQQYLALSPEEERQWGTRLHEQLLEQQEVSHDAAMQRRVERLAKPLVAQVHRDVRYTFTILQSDDINAFSMAGGYVYVNRGLMEFATDDAELQFVLGHEIGHVDMSHCSRQLTYVARASQIATPAAGAIAGVLHDLLSRSYTKDQEFEADAYGLRAIQRAGLTSDPAISFLRRLGKNMEEQKGSASSSANSPVGKMVERIGNHFRTHPPVEERIRRLEDLSASESKRDPNATNP